LILGNIENKANNIIHIILLILKNLIRQFITELIYHIQLFNINKNLDKIQFIDKEFGIIINNQKII
jgi:hypothetical protein